MEHKGTRHKGTGGSSCGPPSVPPDCEMNRVPGPGFMSSWGRSLVSGSVQDPRAGLTKARLVPICRSVSVGVSRLT